MLDDDEDLTPEEIEEIIIDFLHEQLSLGRDVIKLSEIWEHMGADHIEGLVDMDIRIVMEKGEISFHDARHPRYLH